MRDNISQRIELLANIATIVVAVLIGLALIRNFVSADSASPATHAGVKVGTQIALPGVDWSKSDKNLIFVLQKGCHFCSESAPFYQRLIRETVGHHDLQLIAALPQGADEAKQYLDGMGISINEVTQAAPSSVGVRGTPTLLLVNASGTITDAWVGKLPSSKEDEVLRRLELK